MTEPELYADLGVERTASKGEIKKAFKRKASKHHPDKNNGSEDSVEQFKRIQKAYEVLSDSDRRKRYDETGFTNNQGSRTFKDQALDLVFNEFMAAAQANEFKKKDYTSAVKLKIASAIEVDKATLEKLQREGERIHYLAEHFEGNDKIRDRIEAESLKFKQNEARCKEHIEVLDLAQAYIIECSYSGDTDFEPPELANGGFLQGNPFVWTTTTA